MSNLFQNHMAKSGPVECLGQSFPSDEARREHYLKLLAERLKDPEFRKIEGFPIGSDEDILALSNPPFFTACPNPFIGDFVREYGTPYEGGASYSKEPFAADVSEGKNDPIYNAHSYHTKVPHKAIMRYILHYTQPGDIVFDGFCGTGMTGVAAQLCGDRRAIESLGYRVDRDGNVLEHTQEDGLGTWKPVSKIGKRRAVLNDLSPFAAFISSRYNDFRPSDYDSNSTLDELMGNGAEHRELYVTAGPNGDAKRPIDYIIWSEVFSCPSCQHEASLFDLAVDRSTGGMRDEFSCPSCSKALKKEDLERVWVSTLDIDGKSLLREPKTVPVEVVADVSGRTTRFKPTEYDLNLASSFDDAPLNGVPNAAFPHGRQTRKVKTGSGIGKIHQMFTRRGLRFLSDAWKSAASRSSTRSGRAALFLLTGTITLISKRERYRDGSGKGAQSGTLYVPSLQVEKSPYDVLDRKRRSFVRLPLETDPDHSVITTGSNSDVRTIPDNSIEYIFTDPPFGESLQYAELNFFHEAWLSVRSSIENDCVLNYVHKKDLSFYHSLMKRAFSESFRVLKPGRWITVEFSNTQASVWNIIQVALQESGFVVANVSALDKKQGSFNSVTTTTSVKQDLVISAYKPNGGLEDRFISVGGSEESVWDFARAHLKYLPVVKAKHGQLEFIAERDPRIIFDRMVAWFVRHNTPVPMSTNEFQSGLVHRFVERDGMIFLPDQVTEYDKKRLQAAIAPQMEMFVSDERSAIDWLSDFLKRRPSTYQEISPEFMGQLGAGWKKHEAKPELLPLLEDNFLKYDGNGDVPSQIHSYLSTNFKDQRGLEKDDPRLKVKAKDRWYVPDPSKAKDLEQKRERALLKEFENYKSAPGRRLKEFRLEVLRAGFKTAWAGKDYKTIIGLAQKIPEEALQEDEKLLLWYDQALTRMEADA
ncbi:DNA methyltransferase [Rhizobium sp. Root482]|uniref:DNA methyltransferase n=1 Tax=Rhizobium sp. Root482 TaxID=1736543 RepID=UPI0006F94033|nr:DNA methyltransferase [Rhizobium sp. Root482]KQY13165.1 DNA methylase [Rhizobium sp. Root482]